MPALHRGETECSRDVQNSFATTTSAILFSEQLQVLSSFGTSDASENQNLNSEVVVPFFKKKKWFQTNTGSEYLMA